MLDLLIESTDMKHILKVHYEEVLDLPDKAVRTTICRFQPRRYRRSKIKPFVETLTTTDPEQVTCCLCVRKLAKAATQ